jgi:hypothetical protein
MTRCEVCRIDDGRSNTESSHVGRAHSRIRLLEAQHQDWKMAWEIYLDWMNDPDGAKALLAHRKSEDRLRAAIEAARDAWLSLRASFPETEPMRGGAAWQKLDRILREALR